MNEQKLEILKRMYIEEKRSTKEIGQYFGVSTTTVRRWLHRNNIKVRQSTELNRKYTLDESYFDVIDTKNKSYLLGLLCADGYVVCGRLKQVTAVGITLKSSDVEAIELLKKRVKVNSSNKRQEESEFKRVYSV